MSARVTGIAVGAVLAALACSSPRRAAAPEDARTVTTRRSGESTFVSITQGPMEPQNPVCLSYCERLASCWYALPNTDVMLQAKDVLLRCRKEQADCRTPTTDLLCCGGVVACQDFARCEGASRDVVVTECRDRIF